MFTHPCFLEFHQVVAMWLLWCFMCFRKILLRCCYSLLLLGRWTLGPVFVYSAAWRVTAGVIVHWKKWQTNEMPLELFYLVLRNCLFRMWSPKTHDCLLHPQNASHATQNPSISSNMSQWTEWFIAIDPDCVKQAEHGRKVFPLFDGFVWTRP